MILHQNRLQKVDARAEDVFHPFNFDNHSVLHIISRYGRLSHVLLRSGPYHQTPGIALSRQLRCDTYVLSCAGYHPHYSSRRFDFYYQL